MKRLWPLLLLFALAAPLHAADPTPAAPVVLPGLPPIPPVPPAPKVPAKLAADQVYLIRSSVSLDVVDGTQGIVTITPYTGPVTFAHTKFTDGTGYEDRTVTDKYVYAVSAVATGKTDLVISWPSPDLEKPPVAAVKTNRIRVCLDVTGDTPAPPVPPTPPTPPAPVDPLTKALQTAYALDTDSDRAASLAYLQVVYAGMSVAVPSTIKTNSDAVAWIKAKVDSAALTPQGKRVGLSPTQLVNLKKAIGAEMVAQFGTQAALPIDVTALAAELVKISTALANLSPQGAR